MTVSVSLFPFTIGVAHAAGSSRSIRRVEKRQDEPAHHWEAPGATSSTSEAKLSVPIGPATTSHGAVAVLQSYVPPGPSVMMQAWLVMVAWVSVGAKNPPVIPLPRMSDRSSCRSAE